MAQGYIAGQFRRAREGHGTRRVTIGEACDRLYEELRKLKVWGERGDRVIISTNLVLNKSGWPRADQREPADPGVAVYFELEGDPIALACDRYDNVAANIAAIAAHVDASRAIERYGVGTLRQVFRGFTALPAATTVNDWRKTLGEPRNLAEAEANYRDLARIHHPDVGGSAAKMAELNAAIALARKAFS